MTAGHTLHKPARRWQLSLRAVLAAAVLAWLLLPLAVGWFPHAADNAPASAQPIAMTPLVASFTVATASAVLATMLGSAFAAALVLGRFPARALWATLLLIPFVSPQTVWTLSQIACYGRGGLMEHQLGDAWRPALAWLDPDQYVATTLVLAQVHAPLAMLVLMRGFSRLQFAGLEAARLFFHQRGKLRWMLTALRLELFAAYLLVFAMALGNFAVPHAMQCRLHIIEVYLRSANYLDQWGALLAALPLAGLALVAAAGFALLDRGTSYATAAGDVQHSGRTHWSGARRCGVIRRAGHRAADHGPGR